MSFECNAGQHALTPRLWRLLLIVKMVLAAIERSQARLTHYAGFV